MNHDKDQLTVLSYTFPKNDFILFNGSLRSANWITGNAFRVSHFAQFES